MLERFRLPLLQGVLPIQAAQIPAEIIAGLTLAALAIPEVMGYTKISGTPVITGPLAYMPEAVLSAVVFLIGIGLIDLKGLRNIFKQRRPEFWVALITALMVVFVGVEQRASCWP